jgi:hypothetical protein
MAKIKKFESLSDKEGKEDIITLLKEVLKEAESGNILGFAIAYVSTKHVCGWDYAGTRSFHLLGSLDLLKAQMTKNIIEYSKRESE